MSTPDELRARVRAQYGEGIPARSFRDEVASAASSVPAAAPSPARRYAASEEHAIQRAVFERANDPENLRRWPQLALLHAIPNGGHRTAAQAGKLKAEGVKPGVPDLDLPCARGGFFGLRIEVKKPGGTLSPEQVHWMAALEREGHKVAVHETVEGIWAELLDYLALWRTS